MVILDFLYEAFNLRVMSHRFPERHEGGKLWTPHSPDINPCDFFLWGFLKEKVFQMRPENVAQLRAHVVKLGRELSEDLCRRVVTNARVRLQEVVKQNGGHIEHVLHKEQFSSLRGLILYQMSNAFIIIKMCYMYNQWYDISCATL